MSRIAYWGRWVIAGCLTADFGIREWRSLPAAIHAIRSAPVAWHAIEFVAVELVVILFWLAVVNGVLTWVNSAQAALVVFYLFILAAFALRIILRSPHQFSKLWPVNLTIGLGTLIWLMLPSVRAEFWKRKRVA